MIVKLKGNIESFDQESIDVDVQGIVYKVFLTEKNIRDFSDTGSHIILHIYEIIKEDSRLLFGFRDFNEREIFSDLLTVQGVGGKMAINILSKIEFVDVIDSIVNEKPNNFTSISGVGNKLSLRIVNELKEKLKKKQISSINDNKKIKNSLFYDLVSCLENLGYSSKICESTANEVINENKEKKIEDLIPMALKYLSKPKFSNE